MKNAKNSQLLYYYIIPIIIYIYTKLNNYYNLFILYYIDELFEYY